MTVAGLVDTSEVGIILPHEHLLIDARRPWFTSAAGIPSLEGVNPEDPLTSQNRWALKRDPRALRDNLVMDDHELAARELVRFKEVGGSCIVDVSSKGLRPPGYGERLRWISEKAGVHVIAGCGFYLQSTYPAYFGDATVAQLAEEIVMDLTEGIDGSDVKAGVIGEIGTAEVDAAEEKVLRACGMAHRETGVSITIHTSYECLEAMRIVDILTSEGVSPDAIIMGHMDENLVVYEPEPRYLLDYHREVAETGVWVQYDTFGSEWYYDIDGIQEPRDLDRLAGLIALLEAGYEDQLLLSHDVWVKQCLSEYGGWGYDHLVRSVIPMMKQAGLTDAQIRKMTVDNPAKALAIRGG